MRVRILVNPKAGSGAAIRRLPAIRRELERAEATVEVAETSGPGDAARLVRAAHEDGVDCVALVGGDGTLNEASQAFIGPDGDTRDGPVLGIIPSGTGGDFRRTFGLGTSVEEAVARLMASPPRPLDLGVLELTTLDGGRIARAFLNVTSFGIGGLTDRIVNRGPKWIGGKAAFLLGSLRAWAVYDNAPVRVRIDDRVHYEGRVFNVALANGRYFGGGMKIAPDADPADGELDIVTLGDLSRVESLGLSGHIYRGTHLHQPKITAVRGARVHAEPLVPRSPVLIDMDGETPGCLPLTARVVSAGIRFRI